MPEDHAPAPEPSPEPSPAPAAPEPAREPYAALEFELRLLFRRAGAVAHATAARIHPDLEASAYPLLAHIALHPGVHGSELADHVGVGRATISRQVSRLVDLGLVTRAVDPADCRGQLIHLTDDGAARLRAAHTRRVASIEEILADWPAEDVATLAVLLHRYTGAVARWKAATEGPTTS